MRKGGEMKYTAEEVRAHAAILRDWRNGFDPNIGNDDAADMLTAYADSIERAQSEDWRIAFFERWHEAAQEKGYVGIAAAITAVPAAEVVAQGDAVPFFYIDTQTAGAIANPMTPSRDVPGVRAYQPPLPDGEFVPVYLHAAQPRAVPDGCIPVPRSLVERWASVDAFNAPVGAAAELKIIAGQMLLHADMLAAAPQPGEPS
jgi:hypothetical protein